MRRVITSCPSLVQCFLASLNTDRYRPRPSSNATLGRGQHRANLIDISMQPLIPPYTRRPHSYILVGLHEIRVFAKCKNILISVLIWFITSVLRRCWMIRTAAKISSCRKEIIPKMSRRLLRTRHEFVKKKNDSSSNSRNRKFVVISIAKFIVISFKR